MNELETIVLSRDIDAHGLRSGDIGAVVHAYDGDAFQAEFVTGDGNTIALLDLTIADVHSMSEQEILHARKLSA